MHQEGEVEIPAFAGMTDILVQLSKRCSGMSKGVSTSLDTSGTVGPANGPMPYRTSTPPFITWSIFSSTVMSVSGSAPTATKSA